jgi:hypothetical protein
MTADPLATLITALQQTEKAAVEAREHTEERERQIKTLRAQVAELTAKCATLTRDLATERRISAEGAAALDAVEQTYRPSLRDPSIPWRRQTARKGAEATRARMESTRARFSVSHR